MAALPTTPDAEIENRKSKIENPAFPTKRVHAKARWMRFATGLMSLFALLGMLWSSYRLGYAHGRRSLLTSSPSQPTPGVPTTPNRSDDLRPLPALYTFSAPSTPPPPNSFRAHPPHEPTQTLR
jgi:hypothetical protein